MAAATMGRVPAASLTDTTADDAAAGSDDDVVAAEGEDGAAEYAGSAAVAAAAWIGVALAGTDSKRPAPPPSRAADVLNDAVTVATIGGVDAAAKDDAAVSLADVTCRVRLPAGASAKAAVAGGPAVAAGFRFAGAPRRVDGISREHLLQNTVVDK
jgi:hypothetical protein